MIIIKKKSFKFFDIEYFYFNYLNEKDFDYIQINKNIY